MGRLGEILKKHTRVAFDTNLLIYLMEKHQVFITNDVGLKKATEINCLIINDYL
jgi:hypothetical protein